MGIWHKAKEVTQGPNQHPLASAPHAQWSAEVNVAWQGRVPASNAIRESRGHPRAVQVHRRLGQLLLWRPDRVGRPDCALTVKGVCYEATLLPHSIMGLIERDAHGS